MDKDKITIYTPLSETGMPSRFYKPLYRNDIYTIGDLFYLLNKGSSVVFYLLDHFGMKAMEEVLATAKRFGYHTEEFIEKEIQYAHKRGIKTLTKVIPVWEDMMTNLEQVVDEYHLSVPEIKHTGKLLSEIKGISERKIFSLMLRDIYTVEEFLEEYKSLWDMPISRYEKKKLAVALDKEGYRFEDCSKEKYPDINRYIIEKLWEEAENKKNEEIPDTPLEIVLDGFYYKDMVMNIESIAERCENLDDFELICSDELLNEDCRTGYYLDKLLEKYKRSAIWTSIAANLPDEYIRKIITNENKNPSRNALISICLALGAHENELNYLLMYAGHSPLYVRRKRDVVIWFGIIKGESLDTVNENLKIRGLELLFE